MKKNNNNGEKMIGRIYAIGAITLGVIVIITIIAVTISIFAPRERTSKAQEYDLECLTEPRKSPLQECRQ